ncbi:MULTISPECIES: hypothetical protein [Bacillus]|uniref:Uncharacterized protein n=1 Tax=Bacillus glycinifermentans TaxID=1664069 RepID=A0A0T6BI08_9BACI|nr:MULTISPECIES: hypothetical protein [Bacillus]KRT87057.1 hypothetical protein AB447_208810 [Bacillus glycinifermentans]MEC0487108.1 hypothetical protein [Bacillus glycinifermentans]UBF35383.1 hypothetical protein K9N56_23860 [Bacillus sp. PM8313]
MSILLILIILPIVSIIVLRVLKEVITSFIRAIIAALSVFLLILAGYIIMWDVMGVHIPSTPPAGISEIIKRVNESQSYRVFKEKFADNKNKEYDLLGNERSSSPLNGATEDIREKTMDSTHHKKEIVQGSNDEQLGFIDTSKSLFYSVYEWNEEEGEFKMNNPMKYRDYLETEPFFQQPLIMKTLDAENKKYTAIYRIVLKGDSAKLSKFKKEVPLLSNSKFDIKEIRKHKISRSYDLITFGKDVYILKNSE